MENSLVTIAIPFYNSEQTLLCSIKSIFAQTYQNWELILIDDGSNDRSLSIAKSISDPRVRVISDGFNKKLPFRLNQIVDIAEGRFIARMDADDLCSPNRIEKQVRILEDDDSLDLVGTGIVYLNKDLLPSGHCYAPINHNEICKEPWRTFWLCHASLMVRTEWYNKNKYNEHLKTAQDFDLWLRTYENSQFGNISEPLYYYRLDNSFNLKKQFSARRYSALFLFKHFIGKTGLFSASKYAAIQYLKFAVTLMLFASGQRKWLMGKRFTSLDEKKIDFYNFEINHIKKIELPFNGTPG